MSQPTVTFALFAMWSKGFCASVAILYKFGRLNSASLVRLRKQRGRRCLLSILRKLLGDNYEGVWRKKIGQILNSCSRNGRDEQEFTPIVGKSRLRSLLLVKTACAPWQHVYIGEHMRAAQKEQCLTKYENSFHLRYSYIKATE